MTMYIDELDMSYLPLSILTFRMLFVLGKYLLCILIISN